MRKLAVKWGTKFYAMEKVAQARRWTARRAEYLRRLSEKYEERAIERELSRLEQVDQQADPLYETALTLIGAKLGTIAKLVTDNPDAAAQLDPRELDTLMAASLKAHNQRRLIYGGVTERKEDQLTGKDGGPIEISAVRERIAERLALMRQRQEAYDARLALDGGGTGPTAGTTTPPDPV